MKIEYLERLKSDCANVLICHRLVDDLYHNYYMDLKDNNASIMISITEDQYQALATIMQTVLDLTPDKGGQ